MLPFVTRFEFPTAGGLQELKQASPESGARVQIVSRPPDHCHVSGDAGPIFQRRRSIGNCPLGTWPSWSGATGAELDNSTGRPPLRFGVLGSCCRFMAGRRYTKSPRNCPRPPDRRSSGFRRFFHSFPTPWHPLAPTFGYPEDAETSLFRGRFRVQTTLGPPCQKVFR